MPECDEEEPNDDDDDADGGVGQEPVTGFRGRPKKYLVPAGTPSFSLAHLMQLSLRGLARLFEATFKDRDGKPLSKRNERKWMMVRPRAPPARPLRSRAPAPRCLPHRRTRDA